MAESDRLQRKASASRGAHDASVDTAAKSSPTSVQREGALQQIRRSMAAWAAGESDNASTQAESSPKPHPIGERLQRLARKPSTGDSDISRVVYRANSSASQSASSNGAAPTFTAATAKQAIDSKASDYADLSDKLATDWVGKTKAELDTTYADVAQLKHAIIEKFVAAGPPKEQTQQVGKLDPVATQKFTDIDAETHLDPAHGNLKDQFYSKLVSQMQKPDFTDRSRTYPAMKDAVGFAFNMKGRRIPQDRISPLAARNHSVERLYDITTIQAEIDAAIEAPLRAKGAPQNKIDDEKMKEDNRRKAYRHILATGRDPLTTINRSKPISSYGAWFAPGEITPDTSAPPNAEFARMMTLGALQPEWYTTGTVVLNIDRRLSGATREIFKPTAFDGLMSALWCARNLGADDYGVTGGGVGEFLEANVPFTDVSTARAVIPSDDFIADMTRIASQVKKQLGNKSTPTEEMLRGNRRNTSIANTTGTGTGGAKDMYEQVMDRSTHEQNSPSAAPTAPHAANATGGSAPRSPAVATGGVFDMQSGPRAR